MNVQIAQLKYFLALAAAKNYSLAAEQCNVSQPALSMAIKKLEEDMDLILIDRKSNPISLTEKGEVIATQAMRILEEFHVMEKLASDLHDDTLEGQLKISVIPTLAPYIIPLFINKYAESFPEIELVVEEDTTRSILQKLKSSETDAAILATPLDEKSIVYYPLFYEEFLLFSHDKIEKQYILPEEIDFRHLWLLEEGHCMRNQMLKICELRNLEKSQIRYNAGSIESLINITESSGGMTIIPELATWGLTPERKSRVTPFYEPTPAREVSLAHHKFSTKLRLINTVMHTVSEVIPPYMKIRDVHQRIDIRPV